MFTLLILVCCSKGDKIKMDEELPTSENESTEVQGNISDTEIVLIISKEEKFSHLQNENFSKLAEKIDPVYGLTFSLFADFGAAKPYGGKYI